MYVLCMWGYPKSGEGGPVPFHVGKHVTLVLVGGHVLVLNFLNRVLCSGFGEVIYRLMHLPVLKQRIHYRRVGVM